MASSLKTLEIPFFDKMKNENFLFHNRFVNPSSKRVAMELLPEVNGTGKTIIAEAAMINTSGIIIYIMHAISIVRVSSLKQLTHKSDFTILRKIERLYIMAELIETFVK